MIWTLLALISMVVLGGFISYYGDLQGRRWGKKRVSWFGMRPKHTAILITSLTGAFIALFSVVTMMLISPTVREVVLSGERAIRENKRLNMQYEQKRRNYEDLLRESNIQIATAQGQLRGTEAERERIRQELCENQRKLVESQKQLNALVGKNGDLQQSLYQTERGLRRKRVEFAALAQKTKGLQKDNANQEFLNKSISQQNLSLLRENAKFEASKKALTTQNAELIQTQKDLQAQAIRLTHENQALLNANQVQINSNAAMLQTSLEKAQALKEQIRQLTERQNELLGLIDNAGSVASQYAAVRQNPITLRAGEPLARGVIDAHTRPESVRKTLVSLLEDAGAIALLRGAGRGENGRTAMLFNRRSIALAGSQAADEQQTLTSLVSLLAGSDAPILVTARTLTNTLPGEQALIDFEYRNVVPTFRKGEMVARSHTINAGRPLPEVVNAIEQFLQADVRDAAVRRGAVPQVDPRTGVKQVGVFGPVEWVELAEKVRRTGGQVQITAYADQSYHSTDPLRLRFTVTRASNHADVQPESDN